MAEQGWIKLHRCICNNPIWTEEKFNRGSAWVDLILMANHEDKKVLFDGGLIECKRGQKITSIRKLSERWKWSRDKTKRFLDLLQSDGMISYKTDHKKTIINIVNYNVYQDREEKSKPVNGHKKATEKPLTDHRPDTEKPLTDTNKNVKNDKNDKECKEGKEISTPSPSLSFPSEVHRVAYEQFGGMTYKFLFEDAQVEEKGELVTIAVSNPMLKKTIQDRYLKSLSILTGKKISVKEIEE